VHHDALEFPMEKSCWSTLIGSVGLVVDQRFAGGARLCATMHSRRPPVGPVGIDVERPRGTLDDLFRDHHLLDAFEARQVEHSVEQEPLP
jgi:hypothetical protein